MRGRRALTRVAVPMALLSVLLAGGLWAEWRQGTTSYLLRTVTVGGQPLAVAMDHTSGRGFVANGIRTVYMFDKRAGTVLRTVPVGVVPDAVAVDGRARRVFVANARSSSSVSVLDAQTGRVLRSIAVGDGPAAMAVDTRADHVFVVNTGGNSVSMVAAASGQVLRTITVRRAPQAIAVDAQTGRAFVASGVANTVTVLDTHSGAIVRTIMVGGTPTAVVADERARRIFVATLNSGIVSVLDARNGVLLGTMAVSRGVQTLAVDRRASRIIALSITGIGLTTTGRVDVLHDPKISGPIVIWTDWNWNQARQPASIEARDVGSGRRFHVTTLQYGHFNPQQGPATALSGHIVVWEQSAKVWSRTQIYGKDLLTGQTLQISQDPYEQREPAISGKTVVWQDFRHGTPSIYGATLGS